MYPDTTVAFLVFSAILSLVAAQAPFLYNVSLSFSYFSLFSKSWDQTSKSYEIDSSHFMRPLRRLVPVHVPPCKTIKVTSVTKYKGDPKIEDLSQSSGAGPIFLELDEFLHFLFPKGCMHPEDPLHSLIIYSHPHSYQSFPPPRVSVSPPEVHKCQTANSSKVLRTGCEGYPLFSSFRSFCNKI